MTLAELVTAIGHAENRLFCAEFIDNTARMQREKADARARLDRLRKTMIPHDRSSRCPVLPGTPIVCRHDPNATQVQTYYPERLDWTQISEWRPRW